MTNRNLDEVRYQITDKCNMRCDHCFLPPNKKSNESRGKITVNMFKELTDIFVAHLGLTRILITGGEPLLPNARTRTIDLAKHCQNIGIKARLVTNGYFIDDVMADEIARIGINPVQISLDSSNAEVHDAIRHTELAYNKAIAAVNKISSRGIYTIVRATIVPENEGEISKIYELSKSIGASEFRIRQACPAGRAASDKYKSISIKNLEDTQRRLIELSIDSETKMVFLPPFLFDRATVPETANIEVLNCTCGDSTLFIDAFGDVYPCFTTSTNSSLAHKIGNIRYPEFDAVKAWIESPALGVYRSKRKSGECTSFRLLLGEEEYKKMAPRPYK